MIRVQRLTWDEWNVLHVARHNVTPDEVEEVCLTNPMTSSSHSGRLRLIGPTTIGRMLTVILAQLEEPGVYYPVTARPASRKERRLFDRSRGSEA